MPNEAGVYIDLGNALTAQGKLDEAEAAFREAVRLKPDWPVAHLNLGKALRAQGRLGQAEAEFREAVRLQPDWPAAHGNLGTALLRQGRRGEAEANSGRRPGPQTGLRPSLQRLRLALDHCPQSGLRNPSQAVESAKKATELAPKKGGYWNTLGVAQYRAGAWQAAVAALERSMALRQGGDAGRLAVSGHGPREAGPPGGRPPMVQAGGLMDRQEQEPKMRS